MSCDIGVAGAELQDSLAPGGLGMRQSEGACAQCVKTKVHAHFPRRGGHHECSGQRNGVILLLMAKCQDPHMTGRGGHARESGCGAHSNSASPTLICPHDTTRGDMRERAGAVHTGPVQGREAACPRGCTHSRCARHHRLCTQTSLFNHPLHSVLGSKAVWLHTLLLRQTPPPVHARKPLQTTPFKQTSHPPLHFHVARLYP